MLKIKHPKFLSVKKRKHKIRERLKYIIPVKASNYLLLKALSKKSMLFKHHSKIEIGRYDAAIGMSNKQIRRQYDNELNCI